MRALEFLREYTDPDQAKKEILDRVNDLDPSDEEQVALLDRVYTLLHKTNVVDRIFPKIEEKLKQEYSDKTIQLIAEKMAGASSLNIQQKNKFLDNFEQNKCVNHNCFLKDGHYSFDDLFYSDPVNEQMFMEFIKFGLGQKRAGKGEHAFAILSQNITQQGTGDLFVSTGTNPDGTSKGVPVELKVAHSENIGGTKGSTGSGRLGEGGVSTRDVLDVLQKFPTISQAISDYQSGGLQDMEGYKASKLRTPDKPQKSINVVDFVRVINHLGLSSKEREELGKAIFQQRFQTYGDTITEVFKTPNQNPEKVLSAYIKANFNWYKEHHDMGGAWQVASSMVVGARSMITASSGDGMVKLLQSGAIKKSLPAIIPTQGTDTFFQVNPTSK